MFVLLLIIFGLSTLSLCAEGHLDGSTLSLWWGAPFSLILLSLAVGPTLLGRFWHRHYSNIILGFTLAFLLPACQFFGFQTIIHEVRHYLFLEYIPFVTLIGALFIVTGGIRLNAQWEGTPKSNCMVLGLGTLAASFIGTTGASMLLIRPLIRGNAWRSHKAHIIIFFIFLVANIGGALTPLGDPPLFLGFLEGVPFFWPMTHMVGPLAVTAGTALGIFYFLDQYFYKKEKGPIHSADKKVHALSISGGLNLFFLLCIMGAVLLSGLWKPGITLGILKLENITRDGILLLITLLSLKFTPQSIRQKNQFSLDPLKEVARVFLGIFITVIPVLSILKAGTEGALAPFIALANHDGVPCNPAYFCLTGFFSSVLDNAPTYFVFFNMAGGDVTALTTTLSQTLLAISTGAVFMGALTYIGNAPNFMVKAVAETHHIKMPTFLGYMGWSLVVLTPIFLLVTWIFFIS